jgi:hypothetical protein
MDGSSARSLSDHFKEGASYPEILSYLAVQQTELAKADLAIVFGNSRATQSLAARAAYFYHQKYFERIIATGGNINKQGMIEAHCIRDHLRRYGVPDDHIFCEIHAENTQQNIENVKALLQQRGELSAISKVFGIGHVKAGRRFLMTMQRHWPDVVFMFACAWEGPLSFDDYVQQVLIKQGMYAQYARIPDYIQKGFIKEVDITAINQRIRSLRRTYEPA